MNRDFWYNFLSEVEDWWLQISIYLSKHIICIFDFHNKVIGHANPICHLGSSTQALWGGYCLTTFNHSLRPVQVMLCVRDRQDGITPE